MKYEWSLDRSSRNLPKKESYRLHTISNLIQRNYSGDECITGFSMGALQRFLQIKQKRFQRSTKCFINVK